VGSSPTRRTERKLFRSLRTGLYRDYRDRRNHHRPSGESRILALLPKAERERILDRCDRMAIEAKQVLFESHAPIPHVYFPLSGMASMVLKTGNGITVEVGTVGNGHGRHARVLRRQEQPDRRRLAGFR
jgi:hypothetical protein